MNFSTIRHKLVCKFNNNRRTETDVMTCVFNKACPASPQKKNYTRFFKKKKKRDTVGWLWSRDAEAGESLSSRIVMAVTQRNSDLKNKTTKEIQTFLNLPFFLNSKFFFLKKENKCIWVSLHVCLCTSCVPGC